MSFDVYLKHGDETCTVESHEDCGGMRAIGGTDEAWVSITYNYSPFYYKHLNKDQGLRWLNGRIAGACLEALENAITILGTEKSDDYWEATSGNAGSALLPLKAWTQQHPEAQFIVH